MPKLVATEEEYQAAALKWLKENSGKTVNDVIISCQVILENGKIINLGKRIHTIKQTLKGNTTVNPNNIDKEFWIDKMGLSLENKVTNSITTEKDKKRKIALKKLKDKRDSVRKQEYDINNILKEFDVNLELLDKYLARTSSNSPKSPTIMKDDDTTLRSYCIQKGYNYEVVVRAVKFHRMFPNETLEESINRALTTYERLGQNEPANWIYEKLGIEAKAMLSYLKLDYSQIFKDMNKYVINLEEAIRHDIFRREVKEKENKWLEDLYNYLVEELHNFTSKNNVDDDYISLLGIMTLEYELDEKEVGILVNLVNKYFETMKSYEILDVGLETNEIKKLKKIKEYGLDEYDVEESFFAPLNFDKGVLVGRKSELYERRQLLRQYVIDWDQYSDIEKINIINKNHFTSEEINYLNKTRMDINIIQNKIK